MEQLYLQFRSLSEHAHSGNPSSSGAGEIEIGNLHQQLDAMMMLRDALNAENVELHTRLQAAEAEGARRHACERGACVVCMETIANVVCLPCKHLALCASCSHKEALPSCPLCRQHIESTMTVFLP